MSRQIRLEISKKVREIVKRQQATYEDNYKEPDCYAYGTEQECPDCTKQGVYTPCPKKQQ